MSLKYFFDLVVDSQLIGDGVGTILYKSLRKLKKYCIFVPGVGDTWQAPTKSPRCESKQG